MNHINKIAFIILMLPSLATADCTIKSVMSDADIAACRDQSAEAPVHHSAPPLKKTPRATQSLDEAYKLAVAQQQLDAERRAAVAVEKNLPTVARIGMSKDEVNDIVKHHDSYCAGLHVNATRNALGTHEQWVCEYSKRYLYFDNGVLTAVQEPGY